MERAIFGKFMSFWIQRIVFGGPSWSAIGAVNVVSRPAACNPPPPSPQPSFRLRAKFFRRLLFMLQSHPTQPNTHRKMAGLVFREDAHPRRLRERSRVHISAAKLEPSELQFDLAVPCFGTRKMYKAHKKISRGYSGSTGLGQKKPDSTKRDRHPRFNGGVQFRDVIHAGTGPEGVYPERPSVCLVVRSVLRPESAA